MSTNENTRVPNDPSSSRAVEVHRSALLGPQDASWAGVPELAAQPGLTAVAFSRYLHGLRRNWVLATILGVALAAVLGLGVWFGWGPQYAATAYLQIAPTEPVVAFQTAETERQRVTEFAFDIYKDTQHQLLRTRDVLIPALRPGPVETLAPWRGPSEGGRQMVEPAKLSVLKGEDDKITWLRDQIRVSFPGKAEIMEVRLTDRNAEEAAILVNAVVDAYMRQVVDREPNQRRQRLSELERVHTQKVREVREKLANLKQLAETLGTSDTQALSLKQQVVMQDFAESRRQLSRLQLDLRRARGELQAQEALLKAVETLEIPDYEVEVASRTNPLVRQLFDELAWRRLGLAQTESTVKQGAKSAHTDRYVRDLQMVESQLEEVEKEFRDGIRAMKSAEIEEQRQQKEIEVKVLADQETLLEGDLEKKRAEAEELSKSSIDLEMMRSEIKNLDLVMAGIADQRERLKVEIDAAPRVTLLEPVLEVPPTPVNRAARIALTVVMAILGFCVPVGGIVWWDARAERINSSAEVSRGLGLTVLGSVPMIPARVMHRLSASSKRHQDWHMRLTESIDGIAARLLRQAELEQTRVILVSSASGGEGKTSLATQLAMSLARNGRRTVLVDFDLRRPAFDGVFGLPLEPGVTEVLRGGSDVLEVVQESGADNLSVVTAGRWDRQALTALANGAAGSLFEKLRAEYEFVVVDTSPILPVADTRFVSQHVDVVILSVFRDVSRAPKIMAACELLEAFGVHTVETVVTGPSEKLRDRDLRYEPSASA